MSTNEPMTAERLADARAALDEDMSQWGGEYGADLLAEVVRLRALTTVTDEMIERGALAFYEDDAPEGFSWDNESEMVRDVYRHITRAVLDAALGTGEEA